MFSLSVIFPTCSVTVPLIHIRIVLYGLFMGFYVYADLFIRMNLSPTLFIL